MKSLNLSVISPQLLRSFSTYVWGKRVCSFALLTGIPCFGYINGIDHLDYHTVTEFFLTLIATYLLLVHVFSFNDFVDFIADKKDPQRVIRNDATDKKSIFLISITSGGGSLLLCAYLQFAACIAATLIIILSCAYSSRKFVFGKNTPFLSSALHAVGGATLYILGLTVATKSWQEHAFKLSVFIGLSMSAGHIIQEIYDHEVDKLNNIRTHSTLLGKEGAFWLAMFFFTTAFIWLGWLESVEYIYIPTSLIAGSLFVICALGLHLRSVRFTQLACFKFRAAYNLIYVLLCLVITATVPAIGLVSR